MSSIESELLTGASLASPQASRRRFGWEATGVPLELPGAQIDLLLRWLKPNQARRKWSTLLADAGSKNLETAMKLADWLLRHGWSVQYEKRSGSRWNINGLEFPRLDGLREMFQLPDPKQLASDWASASAYRFDAADIAAAHTALASLPLARRLQRFSLLKNLDLWRDEERQGTRRDFSLLARGDSKGVTAAEWNWLAAAVDLEKGKEINGTCAACHGDQGAGGKKGEYPRIAGQRVAYIENQLKNFRSRTRVNIPMYPLSLIHI